MNPTHAPFITFEGIDGAGKSTHISALAQALEAAGHRVLLTREPGGTPLAERLRELVLHERMSPLTEVLLMFAARRDHLLSVIEPALAAGQMVLCDRFTDSTFAYQGAGRGLDWDTLAQLEHMVQARDDGAGLREPDLTLWFDLSAREAAQRLTQTRVPDRFESQPEQFFDAVRSGYARRMAQAPQRMVRIDADLPREQVLAQVLQVAQERGFIDAAALAKILPRQEPR